MLVQMGAGKSVSDFLSERKKNGERQELISNMCLILLYAVQLIITNFVPNFKTVSRVVSENP